MMKIQIFAVHHKSMRWIKICIIILGDQSTMHPNKRAESMALKSHFARRIQGHGIDSKLVRE